jgi:thymidylate synthase
LDDPDKVRGGCYGKRIFGNKSKGSQWDRCLAMLRADPSTRRAVLLLHDPDSVLDALSHDVSCAVSMQLLVRDEMLHAFVSMRSNDAILGLPYDAFLFTMLQELAAATLGYRLGTYVHHAVSMHLYEEDLRLAERILAHEQTDASAEMEPLKGPEYCFTFIEVERELRCHGHSARAGTLPPYWRTLAGVLAEFATGRRCHESRALADAS